MRSFLRCADGVDYYRATQKHVDDVFDLTYNPKRNPALPKEDSEGDLFISDPYMQRVYEAMTMPKSESSYSDLEARSWKRNCAERKDLKDNLDWRTDAYSANTWKGTTNTNFLVWGCFLFPQVRLGVFRGRVGGGRGWKEGGTGVGAGGELISYWLHKKLIFVVLFVARLSPWCLTREVITPQPISPTFGYTKGKEKLRRTV